MATADTAAERARPANRVPLVAVLAANAISGAGNAMAILAIPWFVLETTGSAARMGIAGAAGAIPLVIAGVFGGAIVDRLGFRRMSIISDIASGATVAVIPTLHFTIGLEFWQLLILVFAGALLDAPGTTARQSLIPEVAEEAGVTVSAANGYFGAINRSTALIGPVFAGVFIAFFDAAPLLWFDAATFAVSAALMALAVPGVLIPTPNPPEDGDSYPSELAAGFRWVAANPLIRTLIIMFLVTNLIESPNIIVMTVYAREVYDSAVALGLVLGVFSVGAIVGSMLSGLLVARIPGRLMFPLAFSAICTMYLVLILEPPLILLVCVSFFVGLGAGPNNPFLATIFHDRVPRAMRGRVFGLRSAIVMSATPLGVLLGGALIEATGLQTTIALQLVALASVVVWMLVSPTLRTIDRDESPTPSE